MEQLKAFFQLGSSGFVDLFKTTSDIYPPSKEAANYSWRMNAESYPPKLC
jgi:hypothetical protein